MTFGEALSVRHHPFRHRLACSEDRTQVYGRLGYSVKVEEGGWEPG
jgi:hypothetical protein